MNHTAIITALEAEARNLAARYGIPAVYVRHEPTNEHGPWALYYRLLLQETYEAAPPMSTPEDALEALEDAFWQYQQCSPRFSLN
ncbi:hypothetical protein [uncultured Hymenobacter sp.]|uniref:hypothetical protein n=1 Tax=uncultured Hymenobacter sp. TaxID=170016 RepID=UPI0035C9FE02